MSEHELIQVFGYALVWLPKAFESREVLEHLSNRHSDCRGLDPPADSPNVRRQRFHRPDRAREYVLRQVVRFALIHAKRRCLA